MGVGFEAYDAAGRLQFAADHAVACFRRGASIPSSATIPVDFLPDQSRVRYFDLTVSGTAPLLALAVPKASAANTSRGVGVLNVVRSGNDWTFRILIVNSENADFGFSYWLFDSPENMTTSYGLEVFDPFGVLVFTSEARVMEIADAFVQGRRYAALHGIGIRLQESFDDDFNNPSVAWTYSADVAWTGASGFGFQTAILANGVTYGTVSPNYPGDGLRGYGYGDNPTLFIDVTDLPITATPDPGSLFVSVNATVREVTVSSATNTSTVSPPVTASASGGTAPYRYDWKRRVGGGGVGASGPSDQATFRTGTANQPPGSTWVETWGCQATDAAGRIGYSEGVVFRHIVNAIDLTPDPISYANVSTTTNDALGFAGVASKQITGISQAITLRIERFNYSGNADVSRLLAFKGNSATGPWTQIANLDARGSSTQYADFSMAAGEWFYFYGQAETTSGRKTAAFDVAIWNESAGHVTLASTNLSMIVDADNDFNVADYAPDPVNWANLSISTNDYIGSSSATYGQITGINRPITVRVSISNRSGSMSSASLGVHINPEGSASSSGPWTHYSLNANTNASQDFTLTNGRWIYFDASASTDSGRKDHSYTVTITNVTTGQVIDTFTVSATVDADNNYNVVDYDLDYVDWGNIYFNTTANSYYTPNVYQTMSGINANVTLSVQISDFYVSGGAIQNSLWAMQSASRGDLILANLGNGYYSATVQPGEQVRFAVNIATTGGRREFGFNVYVYNATTGAFLDHLSMSGYVGS